MNLTRFGSIPGMGTFGQGTRWESVIPLATRFWLKVWPRGDCWEWRGARKAGGYGRFKITPYELVQAHRFSYELSKGQIPPGLEIHHLCGHPWCVKPSHLEAVSQRENVLRADSITGNQARQTHCKRGHELTGHNKITNRWGHRNCRVCKNLRRKVAT